MDGIFRHNGLRVIVSPPYPVYVRKWFYKKHRKKRQSQRVKMFSHWGQLLKDDEVIQMPGALHMNENTFSALKKAISQEQK